MSTYRPLPAIALRATADTTGANTGNWTNYFSSSVLAGLHMSFTECYHATVLNAPAGSSAQILVGVNVWGFTAPGVGGGAEYHLGTAGMLLQPGQEIRVYWTAPATGTAPEVTLWFRYDLDDPANRATAAAGG